MTSLRSILIGVTAASLLALPGATAAAAASSASPTTPVAAARRDTGVRFLDFDHTRSVGSETKIRGQVTAKVHGRLGAVQGVRVKLLRQLRGKSNWKPLGTDFTSRKGLPQFAFNVRSKANATYRVVFGGNKKLQKSRESTSVSVYRAFNAQLDDGSGRFHGRVAPRYPHGKIYLEKRSCADCGWKRTHAKNTTGKGRWSFKVGAPPHGRSWWRVTTPATTAFITSHSGVFSTRRR